MAAQILDGRTIAAEVRAEIRQMVRGIVASNDALPGLAVLLVGDDPASRVYVANKKKACAEVGFLSLEFEFPADTRQEALLRHIHELNADPQVHGILLQTPLPRHLDGRALIQAIDPAKDVDGFHPLNLGRLCNGEPGFVPCTPLGVMRLLARYAIPLEGRRVVVVGRSNTVGKPLALLMLREHATVTLAHSRTADLASEVGRADVVVAAAGRPGLIRGEWIRPEAVVVDVGINEIRDESVARGFRLVGDVEFAAAAERAAYITPVPGGVGPMTIATLLGNTLEAWKQAVGQGTSPPGD